MTFSCARLQQARVQFGLKMKVIESSGGIERERAKNKMWQAKKIQQNSFAFEISIKNMVLPRATGTNKSNILIVWFHLIIITMILCYKSQRLFFFPSHIDTASVYFHSKVNLKRRMWWWTYDEIPNEKKFRVWRIDTVFVFNFDDENRSNEQKMREKCAGNRRLNTHTKYFSLAETNWPRTSIGKRNTHRWWTKHTTNTRVYFEWHKQVENIQ